MDAYEHARQLIDSAHGKDPNRTPAGMPAELIYADRMEYWVLRLDPAAPTILRLAARCQHLERWSIPRASYPMDKTGYLTWRRSLYKVQAEKACEFLLKAGVTETEAAEVSLWVSKSGLKTNPQTQCLEDAACLVFLETEIGVFATQHAEYPREKFVDILQKTWRKMTPHAQDLALSLKLPAEIASLVGEALRNGKREA